MAQQAKIWRQKSKRMLGNVYEALVVAPGVARMESQAPDVDGVTWLSGADPAVGEFVRELGLERWVTTEATRVEELARRRRGGFAVVTARAVAQSNVLVEYAAPFLCRRGRLVVAKARPSVDEIAAADRAAKLCGMKRVSRETFELPGDRGHREVIVYERVGNPSVKLPRNTGMAQHHPLGL